MVSYNVVNVVRGTTVEVTPIGETSVNCLPAHFPSSLTPR